MKNYVHKKLTIDTLSYCIVSPRESQAFYEGIDFDKSDLNEELKETNVIYPFYRYGTYDKYDPNEAEYYVPGSSIKGALLKTTQENDDIRKKIMVDDIVINNKCGQIKLKKVWKYQNIHTDKNMNKTENSDNRKIEYQIFFQNVAFEMLSPGLSLVADIYINNAENQLKKVLENVHKTTNGQLDTLSKYLSEVENIIKVREKNLQNNEKDKFNKLKDSVKKQIENVKSIKSKKGYLMSSGGYKGLIRALKKNVEIEDKGAIFIDDETNLPYGIVEVNIKDNI